MDLKAASKDRYLIAVMLLTLASIIYWSAFSINAYNTYHEYTDLGQFTYDMYYHIHYLAAEHGLQYIVFANHITPDLILLLPVFAVVQSALTLLILQAIILSLTGLALFFVARDILKSEKIALIMAFALLANPGMHGMLVFDFHVESLIPLFMLLTFYFAIRDRRVLFATSLLLLLGAMDVAPIAAIALAVGMGAYALMRETGEQRRRWLAYGAVIFISAVIVYMFYGFTVNTLTAQYRAGDYPTLPLFNMVTPTAGSQLGQLSSIIGGAQSTAGTYTGLLGYAVFALAVIFIGFGASMLFDPVVAVILVSPWLAEAFLLRNINFVFIWNQYFGFALGGMMVAALLGLKTLHDRKGIISKHLLKDHHTRHRYIIASIAVCAAILFLLSPHYLYSKNVNNLNQDLLFSMNSTVRQQTTALTSIVRLVPANASLMAPFFTMPHLANRQYFEQIPPTAGDIVPVNITSKNATIYSMGFYPDYILADFNPYISLNAFYGSQFQNFMNITGARVVNNSIIFNGSYGVYAYNGTAILLKRK